MTDQEFDLQCELGCQAERMACLCALLEAFDATGPFSLISEDKEGQRKELFRSLRLFTCICDLARYYSQEAARICASAVL